MGGLAWARLRADVLAFCAVANFTLSYALTKVALDEWHPLAFMGTRFVVMAAIALGVLGAQRRLGVVFGADLPRFALGGLFGFTLYQLGFVLGLDRTSAFSSTLLLTTIPLCSLLFLRIGGVEPVAPAQWGGVGLAAAGIAVFIWAEEGGPRLAEARRGDLLSLGAAASFALRAVHAAGAGARRAAGGRLARRAAHRNEARRRGPDHGRPGARTRVGPGRQEGAEPVSSARRLVAARCSSVRAP
jgi:drug/metabolite transporter (DMT)-like permease